MRKTLYFISDRNTTWLNLLPQNEASAVTVLLLQDAVYLAMEHSPLLSSLANRLNVEVYVGKEDARKRGIQHLVQDQVGLVDYGTVVEMVFEHERIVND